MPSASHAGFVSNNLTYANTTYGIQGRNANGSVITNNTVYQTAGDALHLQDNSQNDTVKNNIFWTTAGYDIFVANNSQVGFASDYNDVYATGTANVGNWQGVVYATRVDWFRTLGFDVHSLSADPQFNNPPGVDGLLGYTGGTDRGGDDDFSLKSTSPNIDAGDPLSFYLGEPQPNGGHVNVGSDGDTLSAAPSSVREVQILSPNGYEQLSTGTPVTINWRLFGLGQSNTVALIDAGGGRDRQLGGQHVSDGYLFHDYQQCRYRHEPGDQPRTTAGVSNGRLRPRSRRKRNRLSAPGSRRNLQPSAAL